MPFFCFGIPPRIPRCIYVTCVLISSGSYFSVFPCFLFFFNDLDFLKDNCWMFYRMALHLRFSDVVLTYTLGLWILQEDYHRGEVPFSSHHVRGYMPTTRLISETATLNTCLGWDFPGYCIGKLFFFPSFYSLFFISESLNLVHI